MEVSEAKRLKTLEEEPEVLPQPILEGNTPKFLYLENAADGISDVSNTQTHCIETNHTTQSQVYARKSYWPPQIGAYENWKSF